MTASLFSTEPRSPTPPPGSDRLPPSHAVLFYEEGVFPEAAVADFLWAGLQAGDGVVLLITPGHAAALGRTLARRGAPLEALARLGRFVQADARATAEAILEGSLPTAARFARSIGALVDEVAAAAPSGRVRAFGECVALLAEDRNMAAAVALEHLWNTLVAERPLALYCAYPLHLFAHASLAAPFLALCDAHDGVCPAPTGLAAPERHSRGLAVLQQQARALQAEVDEHRRAEARLSQAARRTDELLALLGHALRNPPAGQAAHLERLVDEAIAVLHGGPASAAGDPGAGSTIPARFPAIEGDEEGHPVASSSSARRVLVVDDNQDAADMLADALRAYGCEVLVAYDGPSALVEASASPLDVAVLDVGLPGMNGYELATRLRGLPEGERVRLIALTGYGQEGDHLRSREAGFDVHLVKPVEIERLLDVVGV